MIGEKQGQRLRGINSDLDCGRTLGYPRTHQEIYLIHAHAELKATASLENPPRYGIILKPTRERHLNPDSTRQRFRVLRVFLLETSTHQFTERENGLVPDSIKNLQARFPTRQHPCIHQSLQMP